MKMLFLVGNEKAGHENDVSENVVPGVECLLLNSCHIFLGFFSSGGGTRGEELEIFFS